MIDYEKRFDSLSFTEDKLLVALDSALAMPFSEERANLLEKVA